MFIKRPYQYSSFFRVLTAAILVAMVLLQPACRKIQEDLALRFLMNAMTNGRWLVDVYIREENDETAAFEGYEFQFTENNKVYAITAAGEQKGTWKADLNARTIESHFPVTTMPLIRLNEKFRVINNTPKLVEAIPVDESKNVYLKLVKKAN